MNDQTLIRVRSPMDISNAVRFILCIAELNNTQAAKKMGINRSTFQNKLRRNSFKLDELIFLCNLAHCKVVIE